MKRVQTSTTSTSLLCTVITVFVLHRSLHQSITVTKRAESTWFPRQYLESSLKTRIYDLFFLACPSLARAAVLQIRCKSPLMDLDCLTHIAELLVLPITIHYSFKTEQTRGDGSSRYSHRFHPSLRAAYGISFSLSSLLRSHCCHVLAYGHHSSSRIMTIAVFRVSARIGLSLSLFMYTRDRL